jgi:hypothetical protein
VFTIYCWVFVDFRSSAQIYIRNNHKHFIRNASVLDYPFRKCYSKVGSEYTAVAVLYILCKHCGVRYTWAVT